MKTRKTFRLGISYSQVPAEDIWRLQKEAEEQAAAAGTTDTGHDDGKSEANETHVDSVPESTKANVATDTITEEEEEEEEEVVYYYS